MFSPHDWVVLICCRLLAQILSAIGHEVRKGRRYYEDSAAHVPTPPKAPRNQLTAAYLLHCVRRFLSCEWFFSSVPCLCACSFDACQQQLIGVWTTVVTIENRKRASAGIAVRTWLHQQSFARRNATMWCAPGVSLSYLACAGMWCTPRSPDLKDCVQMLPLS